MMKVAARSKDDNKKLTKVLSTKLSIEDYAVFRKLTNIIHQYGAIPEAYQRRRCTILFAFIY